MYLLHLCVRWYVRRVGSLISTEFFLCGALNPSQLPKYQNERRKPVHTVSEKRKKYIYYPHSLFRPVLVATCALTFILGPESIPANDEPRHFLCPAQQYIGHTTKYIGTKPKLPGIRTGKKHINGSRKRENYACSLLRVHLCAWRHLAAPDGSSAHTFPISLTLLTRPCMCVCVRVIYGLLISRMNFPNSILNSSMAYFLACSCLLSACYTWILSYSIWFRGDTPVHAQRHTYTHTWTYTLCVCVINWEPKKNRTPQKLTAAFSVFLMKTQTHHFSVRSRKCQTIWLDCWCVRILFLRL